MRGVVVVVLLCLLAVPVRADPSYQWSPRKKKILGSLIFLAGEAGKYAGLSWLLGRMFDENDYESQADLALQTMPIIAGEAGTFAGLGLIIGGVRQGEVLDDERRKQLAERSRKAFRAGAVMSGVGMGLVALGGVAQLVARNSDFTTGLWLLVIPYWVPQVTHIGLWTLTPAIATRRTLRRGPYQQARWSLRPWVAANRSGTTTAGLTLRF